jgi:hypothetical protein
MFEDFESVGGTARDVLYRFIGSITVSRAIYKAKEYEDKILGFASGNLTNEELIEINLMWQDIIACTSLEE